MDVLRRLDAPAACVIELSLFDGGSRFYRDDVDLYRLVDGDRREIRVYDADDDAQAVARARRFAHNAGGRQLCVERKGDTGWVLVMTWVPRASKRLV